MIRQTLKRTLSLLLALALMLSLGALPAFAEDEAQEERVQQVTVNVTSGDNGDGPVSSCEVTVDGGAAPVLVIENGEVQTDAPDDAFSGKADNTVQVLEDIAFENPNDLDIKADAIPGALIVIADTDPSNPGDADPAHVKVEAQKLTAVGADDGPTAGLVTQASGGSEISVSTNDIAVSGSGNLMGISATNIPQGGDSQAEIADNQEIAVNGSVTVSGNGAGTGVAVASQTGSIHVKVEGAVSVEGSGEVYGVKAESAGNGTTTVTAEGINVESKNGSAVGADLELAGSAAVTLEVGKSGLTVSGGDGSTGINIRLKPEGNEGAKADEAAKGEASLPKVDIQIDGTLKTTGGAPITVGEGITADQVKITAWKIEPYEGGIVRVGDMATEESKNVAAEIEQKIDYLVRIAAESRDSISSSVNAGPTGKEVKVTITAPSGYRLVGAFSDMERQTQMKQGNDGAWLFVIPVGGGIYLSAKFEKIPSVPNEEEESEPKPEPDNGEKLDPKPEPKPEPAPEPAPQPQPEPEPKHHKKAVKNSAETAASVPAGNPLISLDYKNHSLTIDMTTMSSQIFLADTMLRFQRNGFETVVIKVANGSFTIAMGDLAQMIGTAFSFTLKVSGDTLSIMVNGSDVATVVMT